MSIETTLDTFIGQTEAKDTARDVIRAKQLNDDLYLQPWLLEGGTGLGKTQFAQVIAEVMSELAPDGETVQFIEMPANSGWTWFREYADKACSIDKDKGQMYSMRTVLLMDEFQSQKTLLDLFKMILNKREPALWERNGVQYFHDPTRVLVILTTDAAIDPAMRRRCLTITMHPYNRAEMKRGFTKYSAVALNDDALEHLVDRCRPYMGHCVNLCNRLNYISEGTKRVTLDMAKDCCRKMGLFRQGIEEKDLKIMQSIASSKGGMTVDVLMNAVQDKQPKQTKQRIGFLQYLGLIEGSRHGSMLTKKGIEYLAALAEATKNARAKKAAKATK